MVLQWQGKRSDNGQKEGGSFIDWEAALPSGFPALPRSRRQQSCRDAAALLATEECSTLQSLFCGHGGSADSACSYRPKKHVETRVLRFGQQFAVGERVPPSVFGLCDGVTRKEPGNAARRYVVVENEHPQANLQRGWGPDQGCGRQIQVPR